VPWHQSLDGTCCSPEEGCLFQQGQALAPGPSLAICCGCGGGMVALPCSCPAARVLLCLETKRRLCLLYRCLLALGSCSCCRPRKAYRPLGVARAEEAAASRCQPGNHDSCFCSLLPTAVGGDSCCVGHLGFGSLCADPGSPLQVRPLGCWRPERGEGAGCQWLIPAAGRRAPGLFLVAAAAAAQMWVVQNLSHVAAGACSSSNPGRSRDLLLVRQARYRGAL